MVTNGTTLADALIDPDEERDRARIGEVLGEKYQLSRLLGTGGMGAVYEATNTWTRRRVAIKLMRPGVAQNNEAVQRFMQEAQATTQIAHPNIVEVLDMGRAEDRALYIVQEFLTGVDLRRRLDERGAMSPADALDVVVPIAGALAAAHRNGIIHRDIKPENIFLVAAPGGETVPKLIDFGVSKVSNRDEALTKTRTGMTLGTPHYMSPEQVRGDATLDGRADLWAIGAVLFELLAGRVPMDAPNYNVLMAKILTERAPALRSVAPAVPAPIARVVDRTLQYSRDERYGSMEDFLLALLRAAESARIDTALGLAARFRRSLPDAPQWLAQLNSLDDVTSLEDAPTGVIETVGDAPVLETVPPPRGDGAAGLATGPTRQVDSAALPALLEPRALPGGVTASAPTQPLEAVVPVARARWPLAAAALLVLGGGAVLALRARGSSATSSAPTQTHGPVPASTPAPASTPPVAATAAPPPSATAVAPRVDPPVPTAPPTAAAPSAPASTASPVAAPPGVAASAGATAPAATSAAAPATASAPVATPAQPPTSHAHASTGSSRSHPRPAPTRPNEVNAPGPAAHASPSASAPSATTPAGAPSAGGGLRPQRQYP